MTSPTASISPDSPHTPVPDRIVSARETALRKPLPPRVPWSELAPDFFAAWGYPGGKFMPEHVEILGQNGSGKSFFERTILVERARLRGSQIVVIATKPADKTLADTGWPIVSSWPPAKGWSKDRRNYRQVIYWAKADGLGKAGRAKQAALVEDLLEQLWVPDSNTIVAFDEIAYMKELGLETHTARYFREARALGITVVASTQRPQGVTRYMHSESAWSVFFAPKDEEDAERMAQVAGYKLFYKRVLSTLDRGKYEFLLVHNSTREAVISSIDLRASKIGAGGYASEHPKRKVPKE